MIIHCSFCSSRSTPPRYLTPSLQSNVSPSSPKGHDDSEADLWWYCNPQMVEKNTMRSCWFPDSLRATSHLKTPPRLEHDPFSFGFLAYFQDRNVSFTECWVHVKNIGWIRWFSILKTKMETEKWWLEDDPFLLETYFQNLYQFSGGYPPQTSKFLPYEVLT